MKIGKHVKEENEIKLYTSYRIMEIIVNKQLGNKSNIIIIFYSLK